MNQAGADAIQEVTIQTSNYAAEYGQAGGGYINYTMKSGTNQLHGSGFDYLTNTILNAGLPFTIDPNNSNYNIRNPIHQNDYGVTFGGPVEIPQSLQRPRQDVLLLQLRTVPSKQLHQYWFLPGSHRSGAERGFFRVLRLGFGNHLTRLPYRRRS